MRTPKPFLLASLIVAALAGPRPSSAAAEPSPVSARELSRLEILELVEAGDFGQVENQLVELQRRFERSPDRFTEDVVVRSFLAFNSTRPALRAKLRRWRVQMPGSFAARIASGAHRLQLAATARDHQSSESPQRGSGELMARHLNVAQRYFDSAIALNRASSTAWSGLINIAMYRGDHEARDAAAARALDAMPYTFDVRSTYVLALQPKWGGSWQAMSAFIESSRDTLGSADHALLAAYIDLAKAGDLASNGRFSEAKERYDSALAAGEHWRFLAGRASTYRKLGKLDAALEDLNHALELRPQAPVLLQERASLYRRMIRPKEALSDLDLALALDPRDRELLNTRTWLLLASLRRPDDALRNAEQLLALGSRRSETWVTYGSVLLWGTKDAEGARRAFQLAIELNPQSSDAWFGYAQSLYKQHKSSALDAFDRFAYLCSHGAPCDPDDQRWLQGFVAHPATYIVWPRILLKWRLLSQLI